MANQRRRRHEIGIVLGVTAALLLPRASAASDEGPDARVLGSGSARGGGPAGYTTAIGIATPAFHGIEPRLSLTYDSARRRGELGPGWALSGASYIERVSASRGAPRFDGKDVFLRDGSATGELVPCTATSSSPSCKAGGTGEPYMPRYETFERARFDVATNSWHITARDGVESVYGASSAARLSVPSGTLRWYLEEVKDTRGNVTRYSYQADSGAQCADVHLSQIAYGGVDIDLYYEARPDPVLVAGGGCTVRTDKRLKTIDVKVGTGRAAAYALAYTSSTATTRSTLTAVTRWGTASTVSATGAVATGISHVLGRFVYAADPGPTFTTALSPAGTTPGSYDGRKVLFDFTGDGIADLCEMRNCSPADEACTADPMQQTGLMSACSIGKGDGTFGVEKKNVHLPGAVAGTRPFTTDLDADGRVDFCYVGTGNYGLVSNCAISLGDGTFKPIVNDIHSTEDLTGYVARMGDVTGDGIPDICAVSHYAIRCVVGKGDGTFGAVVRSTSQAELGRDGAAIALRDIDGDGNADLCNADPTSLEVTCLRGKGDGGFDTSVTTRLATSGTYAPLFGDLNGDGIVDVCGRKAAAGTVVGCALGQGDGSFGPLVERSLATAAYPQHTAWMADVNGDGNDDVCLAGPTASGLSIVCAASLGSGALDAIATKAYAGSFAGFGFEVADVDGDGAADVCALSAGVASGAQCARATSIRPNFLEAQTNAWGGKTTIAYRPSTAWHNTYLPPGFIAQTASSVTIDDGRGNVSSRPTTYEGGLFHLGERRFLGFSRSTTTVDGSGTRRVTTFRQTLAGAGRIAEERLEDGTGKPWAFTRFTYSETTAAPLRSLLTEETSSECNLGTTCRETKTQRSYDAYGNVILVKELGDVAITGDERTTQVLFYPNVAKYIVGLAGAQNELAGAGTDGLLLHRMITAYDGLPAGQPPTAGNPTESGVWNSKDGSYLTTKRTFDATGNVLTTADSLGGTTTVTWDEAHHRFPVKQCNALGQCSIADFDARLGVPRSRTDANGKVTSFAYDSLGRETATTLPNGGKVVTSYVGFGAPATQYVEINRVGASDAGIWSRTYVDGLGRTYKRTREGGFAQETAFALDVPSRVAKASAWYGATETARYDALQYDGAGRVTKTTHADGTSRTTAWSVSGRTDVDEKGHTRSTTLDAFGRPVAAREHDGSAVYVTAYAYDAAGRLVKTTDAQANVSTVTYNSLDRTTKECNPDTGCTVPNYDALARLKSVTTANSETLTMTYDALSRLVKKTLPGEKVWSWAYDEPGHGDAIGRLTSQTFPAGKDDLSYDAMGHVTTEAMCRRETCNSMRFTFDNVADGRLDKVTYPDNEIVDYGYDAAGNVASVSGYASAIVHDARGRITKATLANGTTETFAFDPTTFLPKQTIVKKGAAVLYQSDLGFGPGGLLTSLRTSNGETHDLSYAYDPLDRLVSVKEGGAELSSFAYDALGNVTRSSRLGAYAYADPRHKHAVTTAGGASYAYDANGNMLTGPGKSLQWDAENRLVRSSASGGVATFEYDGSGQRVEKSNGSLTTRYFGELLEHDGTQLIKYVVVEGRRLARHVGTTPATKIFYHQDQVGSVRLVTDGTGSAAKRYDYQPFGDVERSSGALEQDVRFGGHRADDETGLVYMNARYYDPKLARFVSADSVIPRVFDPQSLNRYAYARNNPLVRVDPSGHSDESMAMNGDRSSSGGSISHAGNKESKDEHSTHPAGSEAHKGVGHSEHIGGGKDRYVIDSLSGTIKALGGMSQKMNSMAKDALRELAEKAQKDAEAKILANERLLQQYDAWSLPGPVPDIFMALDISYKAFPIKGVPGLFNVVIHGSAIMIGDDDYFATTANIRTATLYSVDDMVHMIASNPNFMGKDVMMISCQTAGGPAAAAIAAGLGALGYDVDVFASTTDIEVRSGSGAWYSVDHGQIERFDSKP